MNSRITNIAAYKFVRLDNLDERRTTLRDLCDRLALKGTILLSPEGINLFLAGDSPQVDEFLKEIRRDPSFSDLEIKESPSADQPFNRLLVKIKKEIIAFDDGKLQPLDAPSPKIDAQTLKQWLDEGRPLTLLDVRNDYEIRLGKFRDAVALGIDNFREFPERISDLPAELKGQPVVMYCTGGIRCEKAGPFMEQFGFEEVYQLNGGILKYFEECGGDHYDGDCFVFDQRVAVDDDLQETDTAMCFACQAPLTREEQESPQYVPSISCPYCYVDKAELLTQLKAKRERELAQFVDPLPGSAPYENRRPMHVPGRFDGRTLIEFLEEMHPHINDWPVAIEKGLLQRSRKVLAADDRLRAGDRIEHVIPNTVEPDVSCDLQWIYEDESLVVLNKPAPLPMHPCGRFNRNTLLSFVEPIYRPQKLRVAHRLDANTTGVVLLARTRPVAALLQPQFERNEVEKRYLVKINGAPQDDRFEVDAPIGKNAIHAGSRAVESDGLPAKTIFRVLRRDEDGTTLVEAQPITGRTNQIRLHLLHAGYPIVGDQIYRENPAATLTHSVDDPPLCLHAWKITFRHPDSDETITLAAPPPAWAGEFSLT